MADRPYVLLSCAMSIDGYIDDASPERLLLSNAEDFDRVDEVRAGCDAILIGANTIRRDNPRLLVNSEVRRAARTARGLPAYPLKVTLTLDGELNPDAKFFNSGGEKIVYCAAANADKQARRLEGLATVVAIEDPTNLATVLEDLANRNVRRLMVEGGGTIHTQFLTADLVDEIHLAVAPFFVGDPQAPRFVNAGVFPQSPRRRMTLAEARAIGDIAFLRYIPAGHEERAHD